MELRQGERTCHPRRIAVAAAGADNFRRVGPRLAVFSPAHGGPAVIDRTRRSYTGRVDMGEDLMRIEIGDEVVVRRRGPAPPR
jgi:hypothetical protein